ncbi:MAG: condensation domain-containing protein, partial [Planctomycetota bacterium]
MSNTSKRIENLSPEKRALLEKKLKEKKLATSMRKSIPRRENPGVAPLSYAQQRLWFLNQLEPDSPFYNISQVFRIHGTINVESLHKALNAIINRHEILRTSFKLEGEQPVQVISTKLTLDLPTINISESPGKKRETRIQNLISDFTQQPFDLTCGPLILFHLIRIDSQEHIFVVVMHHIISDGWSMGIFNRELEALYNSFCSGEPYTPQELPIQYADFSQWQRQWFKGNVMENQLDYWRKQFKNVPSLLDLPIDHQRPLIQSFRGSKKSVLLSNELTRALKALSIKKNTTLFMTLLAAFQLLLFRYTGQKIIVTGSPIANRTISEIENLIGFFVNTLVFRADFSDNPTFSELLKQ